MMNISRGSVIGAAVVGLLIVAVVIAFVWQPWDPSRAHPEGEAPAAAHGAPTGEMAGMAMEEGVVHLDPSQIRALGVRVVEAELGPLRREIRTTGIVTWDETRLSTVTPRFGGFVEDLHVDFTGRRVTRGEPLLEIYSPALVSAQEELLSALRLERTLEGSRAPGTAERSAGLVESARRRLLLWEISASQIEELERSGEVRRTMTLHAPSSGFVVEKAVQAGESVEAGRALFRLADLSTVWIDADVYERDIRFVHLGDPVAVAIDAYPGDRLPGRVAYIHPEVRPETRTVQARIELSNPGDRIKPGMFATVHLDAAIAERALLVPRDAVLYTGTRAIVFVEENPGVFRLREVEVGAEAGGRTQILSGLLEGERVVARAGFLLDADSRLMEVMEAMPGMEPAMPGMESDTPGTAVDMPGMEMDMPSSRSSPPVGHEGH